MASETNRQNSTKKQQDWMEHDKCAQNHVDLYVIHSNGDDQQT